MSETGVAKTARRDLALRDADPRESGVAGNERGALPNQDGHDRPVPRELTLDEAFGSVEPRNRPEDFEELSRLAKEEHAERSAGKLGEG